MRRATRAKIALAFSGLCIAVLVGGFAVLASLHQRATVLQPSPEVAQDSGEDAAPTHDENGFPIVDWAFWQGVNADVIGWITIPGTPVDYPIVQAPADDPDYYLKHDVYGQYNYMGARTSMRDARRMASSAAGTPWSSGTTWASATRPCSTRWHPSRMPVSRAITTAC